MAKHEYEVSFKVKSDRTWSHIINNVGSGPIQYFELHAANGAYYRVPEDANIKDISPLREGYYLIEGHANVYRYLVAAPRDFVEYYTGTKWAESDLYYTETVEEWRNKAQYLGPLDPDDETL